MAVFMFLLSIQNLCFQCSLIVIEVAQPDAQQLVVEVVAGSLWGKFHTNVVAREPVHSLAAGGFLEEHFGFLTDVASIESLRLLVGKVEQLSRAKLFLLIGHDIGDAQGGCSRALRIGKDMQLGDIQLLKELITLLKALRGLSPAAHHHIDTDESIGHQ